MSDETGPIEPTYAYVEGLERKIAEALLLAEAWMSSSNPLQQMMAADLKQVLGA